MIFKKIIDLCKKRGIVRLYDGKDVQWISDGFAIYPMYNLPKFDENTLCKTYDITDKQQDKIHFFYDKSLPGNIEFSDVIDDETLCKKGPMVLSVAGGGAVPYMTSQGIKFINSKYLAPLSDTRDDMLEVYERLTKDGHTYFAVKSGLILMAIIMPYEVINQQFVDDLSTLATMCRVALDNKNSFTSVTNNPTVEQTEFFESAPRKGD